MVSFSLSKLLYSSCLHLGRSFGHCHVSCWERCQCWSIESQLWNSSLGSIKSICLLRLHSLFFIFRFSIPHSISFSIPITKGGHCEIAKVLIERGANVNQVTSNELTTPLHVAAEVSIWHCFPFYSALLTYYILPIERSLGCCHIVAWKRRQCRSVGSPRKNGSLVCLRSMNYKFR